MAKAKTKAKKTRNQVGPAQDGSTPASSTAPADQTQTQAETDRLAMAAPSESQAQDEKTKEDELNADLAAAHATIQQLQAQNKQSVPGEVQTNSARRQDLVDAYYKSDEGLSWGGIAQKFNVKVSDVVAAVRDSLSDKEVEAKAELQRTADYFLTKGE